MKVAIVNVDCAMAAEKVETINEMHKSLLDIDDIWTEPTTTVASCSDTRSWSNEACQHGRGGAVRAVCTSSTRRRHG